MIEIGNLICGGASLDEADESCEISGILTHLKSVINTTINETQWLFKQPDEKIAIYGPFLARSLIEVSMTALVGRIDPTRLIVVKRVQEHQDYDTSKPWNSAIRWQGDVMDNQKSGALWTSSILYKDIPKALLGDYYSNLYWHTAFKKIIDTDLPGQSWLAEIKNKTIDRFTTESRTEIAKLYSESSKGIHSEFVVPPGSIYDKATIQNLTTRTIKIISDLGLLINFVPHIPHKLNSAEAVTNFNAIESSEFFNE